MRLRLLLLWLVPALAVPTATAPAAGAAKARATPAKGRIVKRGRRTLARTGVRRVRVRARRAGRVKLSATLAGVAGPAVRAKRVRFARRGRKVVKLRLAAYARSVLGGC